MARHPLVAGGSGAEGSKAVTARRTEEDSLDITKATLKKINVVIVLQDEGIIYCPIPKISSSEWKRSLRWMVGVVDYDKYDGKTHSKQNGLSLLADRGLKETQWALETDRFYRFVVVREPAERLLSAFLGKCVKQGCTSGHLAKNGAPHCPYLTAMPELFPGTTRASLATHARLKELVETDPVGTFYHFVNGIWRHAKAKGDTCKSWDVHHRPQACFCDLPNLLSAFHVIPISNLSAEAEALAGRLPTALPESGGGVGLETMGVGGAEGVTAMGRRTGVSDARREEIHQFLKKRFTVFHEVSHQGTQADEKKENFLSEPVMELIHEMYKADYDLLGDYF